MTTVIPKLFSCVICSGSSQCTKCRLKTANDMIRQYKERLDYILNISSEQLQLTYYQEILIDSTFKQSSFPFEFIIPDTNLEYWHFITITFDPEKFGVSNPVESERKYILCQLSKLIHMKFLKDIYGCFEQHNNGRTHAHFIAFVLDNDYKQYLKRKFTDNPRNNIAVKPLPAMFPQVIKYIQKESTAYYITKYYNNIDI